MIGGDATNTLALNANDGRDATHGLIALIQGFDARLKALESTLDHRPVDARPAPERDWSELARIEWDLRERLAEADMKVEQNDLDCGCTVAHW